jgi:hypothetical protein
MTAVFRVLARVLDALFPSPPNDLTAVAEAAGVLVVELSEAELLAIIAASRMRTERAVALHPALRDELTDEALADVLTEWSGQR